MHNKQTVIIVLLLSAVAIINSMDLDWDHIQTPDDIQKIISKKGVEVSDAERKVLKEYRDDKKKEKEAFNAKMSAIAKNNDEKYPNVRITRLRHLIDADKKLFGDFLQVIEKGEKNKVKALLKNDIIKKLINVYSGDVSDPYTPRYTSYIAPLYLAALKGRDDIVKLLIETGADINALSGNGHTPLMGAVMGNHSVLAQWLISHGAKVNFQYINAKLVDDGRGDTALIIAAQSFEPDAEMVRLLLENGTDVNLANRDGDTPLFYAVHRYVNTTDKNKREEWAIIVRLLLDYGAFVSHRNNKKKSIIDIIGRTGDELDPPESVNAWLAFLTDYLNERIALDATIKEAARLPEGTDILNIVQGYTSKQDYRPITDYLKEQGITVPGFAYDTHKTRLVLTGPMRAQLDHQMPSNQKTLNTVIHDFNAALERGEKKVLQELIHGHAMLLNRVPLIKAEMERLVGGPKT